VVRVVELALKILLVVLVALLVDLELVQRYL
jgi:hypothetical protein